LNEPQRQKEKTAIFSLKILQEGLIKKKDIEMQKSPWVRSGTLHLLRGTAGLPP